MKQNLNKIIQMRMFSKEYMLRSIISLACIQIASTVSMCNCCLQIKMLNELNLIEKSCLNCALKQL